MKRYQITLEGQTFDVRLLSDPHQEQVQVEVDGVALTAQVKALPPNGEQDAEAARSAEPAAPPQIPGPVSGPQATAVGSNVVTAPLPGLVKLISVIPGQQVSSGDQLLVIEAMKMDNIIRASRDGTIAKIHVSEGRQVAYGERMIEYAKSGPA